MLFTTFLLVTAGASAAVQGAMLLRRKQDAQPTTVPYGAITVGAAALGLVALGVGML